jgi:predicted lipid-binding transport protein (Tim44 family)
MQWLRSLVAFAAMAVALLLWAEDAEARLEGGPSVGTSAEGTLLAPPVATPIFLVMAANDHVTAAQSPYPGGSLGGLFNRPGLLGGFAAGFLGSGVLGLLFGHGLVGELGSVASVLGLVFQLALIALLCRLIWTWWSGHNAPAFAGLSPRQLADPYLRSRHEFLPDIEAPPDADDVAADNHRVVSK